MNVTVTEVIGTRVLRVIGPPGTDYLRVCYQLELFIEHVTLEEKKREKQRTAPETDECQDRFNTTV
jgi:hypothetical protein